MKIKVDVYLRVLLVKCERCCEDIARTEQAQDVPPYLALPRPRYARYGGYSMAIAGFMASLLFHMNFTQTGLCERLRAQEEFLTEF